MDIVVWEAIVWTPGGRSTTKYAPISSLPTGLPSILISDEAASPPIAPKMPFSRRKYSRASRASFGLAWVTGPACLACAAGAADPVCLAGAASAAGPAHPTHPTTRAIATTRDLIRPIPSPAQLAQARPKSEVVRQDNADRGTINNPAWRRLRGPTAHW